MEVGIKKYSGIVFIVGSLFRVAEMKTLCIAYKTFQCAKYTASAYFFFKWRENLKQIRSWR